MPESCPKSYVMGCVYLFLFNFRFRISDSNPLDSEIRAASCEFEYRSDGLSLRDCDSAGETSYQRILGHCDAGVAARLCFSSPSPYSVAAAAAGGAASGAGCPFFSAPANPRNQRNELHSKMGIDWERDGARVGVSVSQGPNVRVLFF